MSFSDECRKEFLTEDFPKNPCCRRALAYGLLFASQTDSLQGVFFLRVPAEVAASDMETLLQVVKGRAVSFGRKTVVGRSFLEVRFCSKGVSSLFQTALISDLPLPQLLNFHCEQCSRFFLRGVLAGCLSVADPRKSHHLELNCRDAATALRVEELLDGAGITLRRIQRGTEVHLYTKNSTTMEDLFSYLHANRAFFELVNAKIECDIRNNENRATNCVTRNIGRAVEASSVQLMAIERLRSDVSWGLLPESLRQTAQLRLDHPDATLSELALLHNPPITKSGLNHRLKKLTEAAGKISEEKDT